MGAGTEKAQNGRRRAPGGAAAGPGGKPGLSWAAGQAAFACNRDDGIGHDARQAVCGAQAGFGKARLWHHARAIAGARGSMARGGNGRVKERALVITRIFLCTAAARR